MDRAACNKFYSTQAKPGDIRALALGDLFYLLVYILGRRDADNDWVFARCREVQAKPNGHLDLWAREHYKSTIITFALTIQDILNNPEITVGIFSHTRKIAVAFLLQIKIEFENNQLLQELFPEVLWGGNHKTAPSWSLLDGITVRREGNPKEPTVAAWGLVDGQPTSKHYQLMVYDDVVTRESVTTPEQIIKVTDAWALSRALGAKGGQRRYIGTRYHFNDTYAEMLRRGAAIPRIHTATIDGAVDGAGVFLSREELDEKRKEMGPYIFGCQMLQNPKADTAMGFKAEWFRTYSAGQNSGQRGNIYILVDPASAKKKDSDYTVMWVVELAADGNYYILDGVRDRLNLTERAKWLFALHRKYRPIVVGYEKYGQQADIEHIQYLMDQEHYHFGIVAVGGQVPKNDRIRGMVPLFEQGRVYFPYQLIFVDHNGQTHDLTQDFLNEEYLPFPVCGHDDMLDCLARILDKDMGAAVPAIAITGQYGANAVNLRAKQHSSTWDD